ncbi:MAG: type restriction endonuclease [Ignavibacteria bacterium]|nr:type restriction endonuclease [Ignavibacteria bacterium]
MKLVKKTPTKALNKAFLKQRPTEKEINTFKEKLSDLLDKIKKVDELVQDESEEHLKNYIRDFLLDTYYKDSNEINTKDKKDLVIHLGKTVDSEVGVLIEAKRPSNKGEMITDDNPNKKALHEIILYYFDERNKIENNNLKHLIITNINEWYIFDTNDFDKLIYRNTKIKNLYETKVNDKKDNQYFYEVIAKILPEIEDDIHCIYFNIKEKEQYLKTDSPENIKEIKALYKIFSPVFLLKLPYSNDSNSLNEKFYKELLYIIGLEEVKEGNKFIIRRKKQARQPGSFIENIINKLLIEEKLDNIKDKTIYGQTEEEQLFNIALELSLTWINRILFLKLLEGQLITYHKGNKDYCFLDAEKVNDFNELYNLFHQVLAINVGERTEQVKKKYALVPYLNSSLFEFSDLEKLTIKVESLDNSLKIELMNSTILSEERKKTSKFPTLEYLFKFLDSYDFASEGEELIAEEKTIINASVLGKVFEKINGYKDGSIFTPGFITMYMSRESVRLAVVQKFNEYCLNHDLKDLKIDGIEDIYNIVGKNITIKDANEIINSLRICDPAVGSGHFLVSVLNEIIAIKSELGILVDKKGKRLKDYEIVVDNDELYITDEYGIFEYNYKKSENQRVQETIFNEKQTIIENCLFGVDINPKSVQICRLRLWIELLKNAYYKAPDFIELETLPNIDINIKCGNSLISRYSLDDKSINIRDSKIIPQYKDAVRRYKNEKNREKKKKIVDEIQNCKDNLKGMTVEKSLKAFKLMDLKNELKSKNEQDAMFVAEMSKKEKHSFENDKKKLKEQIDTIENELQDLIKNPIYKNAFEYRFEFPEVLNNNGKFEGFDIVIGNPPYFGVNKENYLQSRINDYNIFESQGDIYSLFIERGLAILKEKSLLNMIISNKWLRAKYGESVRNFLTLKANPFKLVDFNQILLFDSAIVHSCILELQKEIYKNETEAIQFEFNLQSYPDGLNLEEYFDNNKIILRNLDLNIWNINKSNTDKIKQKIEEKGKKLKNWDIKINYGIKTALNEAFIINGKIREIILQEELESKKFIKPILRGRDTRKYFAVFKDLWLINIPKGYTIKTKKGRTDVVFEPMPRYGNLEFDDAWDWFYNKHPLVAEHLLQFKQKAMSRDDKGDYWWELRACSYINEFNKPKIIFSEIVSEPQFYYDEKGYYPEATVFFITGEKIKYLTALLNSKPVTYFFKTFYMGGELVGKIRYKKAFLEQVPIPVPDISQENQIIDLVDQIIEGKKQNYATTGLERQIDIIVYKLYDLTDEEIKIVEGN